MQHYKDDSFSYQKDLADTTQMYEKRISKLIQLDDTQAYFKGVEEELETTKKHLIDPHYLKKVECKSIEKQVAHNHVLVQFHLVC